MIILRFRRLFFVCILLFVFGCNETKTYTFDFQNPDLDIEFRVNDLLSQMTLEEKVSQMR